MMAELLFAAFVLGSLGALALLPTVEPLEAQAAQIAAPELREENCTSAACVAGWDAATAGSINDEAECRRVIKDQAELVGCLTLVQEARRDQDMQWAVENSR